MGKYSIKPIPVQTQPMGEVFHKTEERNTWHLVVDANCFLDEESTKSLQLLEGLKGTHLIIPQIGKQLNSYLVQPNILRVG